MTIELSTPACRPAETPRCEPNELSLKSHFLGPQSENADWLVDVVQRVVSAYVDWRRRLYPDDGPAISSADQKTPQFQEQQRQFDKQLSELLARFEGEVPKFSPRYIGHMFSETSMPALVGHLVTLLHNPNNISGESSRVGVELEAEAIDALGAMMGYSKRQGFGHFTSGGTLANFEAMVRARHRLQRFVAMGVQVRQARMGRPTLFEAAHMGWKLYGHHLRTAGSPGEDSALDLAKANPFERAQKLSEVYGQPYRGPVVLVPDHKHYSWVKGVRLMGLGGESFWSVPLDGRGVMSVEGLQRRIEEARRQGRPILMVVSVAGTTELGAFDPVDGIQDLLDEYATEQGVHIYHHVDAAYGGFFAAHAADGQRCELPDHARRALAAIRRANSLTLDPHKLGYVPYASGAFLARSRREYFMPQIDAPYLRFRPGQDRGPQTIEGSRSAAGAVATWLTARTVGLDARGYGRILGRTIVARRRLEQRLNEIEIPVRTMAATSNILTFCVAHAGEALSATNERTARIYEAFSPDRDGPFFVSRTTLFDAEYGPLIAPFIAGWQGVRDDERLALIRLTVMNPFIDSRETTIDYAREFARALTQVVDA